MKSSVEPVVQKYFEIFFSAINVSNAWEMDNNQTLSTK